MCFDTCVSTDPLTGSKYIPASARVDPTELPFYPLESSTSDEAVKVTLFHLGSIGSYRQAWADDTWDSDAKSRFKKAAQPVELPVLSALIEHPTTKERWLWDLGMSNDTNVLPKVFSSGAIKFMWSQLKDHGQLKNVLLKKFGVESINDIGLSGIILSHAHVDHYGNLLDFPTSLPVYVGPGTMDWIGGGEDAAERGQKGLKSFPSSFLKDRRFVELDKLDPQQDAKILNRIKETKFGPFDRAWDWFGDGSLLIASAEGHCPGHMVVLARTTTAPQPSYVLLSGDAAHQQALYHPLPPPLQLDQAALTSSDSGLKGRYQADSDRRATPGYFDRASDRAVTDRAIRSDQASCMQDFPDKAMRTLSCLSRTEACSDVMVILAHEHEFVQAVDLKEGDELVVNDWKQQAWKAKKIELGRQKRQALAQA